jgi:hypothetical protein
MNQYYRVITFFIFCAILIVGLTTYKTYGTYWDEMLQRDMGIATYDYIFNDDDAIKTFKDRDYGVVTEFPLYAIETNFFHDNIHGALLMRHLVCFLIYFVGLIFFFLLLLKLNFNKWWAIFGMLMLVISPRIFGHAFFNSKDIPLMVFYIISFYTLIFLIEKRNIKYAIIHAIASGILIDTRITGVIIIPLTMLFFTSFILIENWKNKIPLPLAQIFKILIVYIITSAIVIYSCWPFLWENPVTNFLQTFKNMSSFRWDGYNLLMGEKLRSLHTPWYYLPKWVFISTPIFYLVFFVTSIILLFTFLWKEKVLFFMQKNRQEQIMVISFLFLPIITIIVLNSTLYDSWRHIYFTYPFILIVALYGITAVHTYLKKYNKGAIVVIIAFAAIAFEAIKMVQSHPYHYIYFNEFAGSKKNQLIQNNEVDFWGVSFKQAMEQLLKLDPRDKIKINGNCAPVYNNFLFLKGQNKNLRLVYVWDEKDADYYLTNFRYDANDHADFANKKLFSLTYNNSEFITVFKLK